MSKESFLEKNRLTGYKISDGAERCPHSRVCACVTLHNSALVGKEYLVACCSSLWDRIFISCGFCVFLMATVVLAYFTLLVEKSPFYVKTNSYFSISQCLFTYSSLQPGRQVDKVTIIVYL